MALLGTWPCNAQSIVQRNEVGVLAGPYNLAFYSRHNEAYRTSAAVHYAHAKAVIAAGRHVLVDKPFVMHVREAEELASLAAAKSA